MECVKRPVKNALGCNKETKMLEVQIAFIMVLFHYGCYEVMLFIILSVK